MTMDAGEIARELQRLRRDLLMLAINRKGEASPKVGDQLQAVKNQLVELVVDNEGLVVAALMYWGARHQEEGGGGDEGGGTEVAPGPAGHWK